jgi:dynein heavy chain
MTSSVN